MTDSPIENYLDDLFVEVRRTSPRDARSLLSEIEAHLHDAADEARRDGMSAAGAEAEAVRRLGDARLIASDDRRRGRTEVLRAAVVSAWCLGAIGAIAVGVSGLLAGAMRAVGASNRFLVGGRSTAHLNPADCVRWLQGYPHARTCAEAATNDWAWETVGYRIALGVLGVMALGVFLFLRRRARAARRWSLLPAVVTDAVATTVFGVAGLWLGGLGADAVVVSSGAGAGQWLCAAPVALLVGSIFGLRLFRDVEASS